MKNFKKILPAIALVGAGVVAVAGAGDASAYNYAKRLGYNGGTYSAAADPSDVEICYTLSNITVPISSLTYSVSISTTDGINLSTVTKVDSTDTTYGYNSSNSTSGTITINFNGVDGSSNEVTRCAHLDFSNAISASSAFGEYTATLGRFSANPSSYPVDTTNGKTIKLGYLLAVDANEEPTTNNNGIYQADYWVKDKPTTYSSTLPINYGHIEVTEKVKGNAADPDQSFEFSTTVTKLYPSIEGADDDYDYQIYVDGGGSARECTFGQPCTFSLKHGQKAYIGCSSASTCSNTDGQLTRNGVSYVVTQTNAHSHQSYVDDNLTTTATTTGTITLNTAKKEHTFTDKKTNTIAGNFFNILPFVILALLATVGVVTLRKTNKKNEA